MRFERSSTAPIGRCGDEVEFVVLALLLDRECPGPCSAEELGREVGCELLAANAVERLHAAGLAHRAGGFVWPTRAASRFRQLLRE